MVEIRNREDLEKWLQGEPIESRLTLSTRSVFRAVPSISDKLHQTTDRRDWKRKFIGPLFRSLIFASVAGKYNQSFDYLRQARNWGFRLSKVPDSNDQALEHLSISFLHIRNQTASIESVENCISAMSWSSSAIGLVNSTQQSKEPDSIVLDLTALDRSINLWTQPLWLDDTPEWAVRGWETLATELTKRAPHWKTLVRWYEDRLHGDDWAAAQGRPAVPELEIARASLPDSYWKKGGKAVNEAIAALEAFFWEDKPLEDPVLRGLVGQVGVITEEPVEIIDAIAEGPIEAPEPSALPPQSHGPHFGLRDGLLDFAPPEHLDPARNNIQRLKSLHPLLKSEAHSAIDVFGRNMAHGRIHEALRTYAGLLDGDVTSLNYDLIAGIGVKLQSEEAAALEAIADGLEPAFERSETAALKMLLDLHGPFILATDVGQTFVAAAERWERNPRQEKQFRQSASKLADAIEADGIATPATIDFVKAAAADIGLGPQPERSAVFGISAIRNVSIALVGSAAIYVGANAVMSWDMTHWLSVILLTEGIKKSDVGVGVTGLITDAINDVTRGEALKRIYDFALRHEAPLRALAGKRREFAFLNEWLDWLKSHRKPD